MIALGLWLKHLVLIVIISVIADLLLPTKSMQKYVRAVLGIAIIAAMIQPITPLFRQNWADQMASAITDEVTHNGANSTAPSYEVPSVASIRQELQSQEASQADLDLADATKEALPQELRDHVTSLSIQGATTPDKLQALVVVDQMSIFERVNLQKTVADELRVSASQVTVRVNGGE